MIIKLAMEVSYQILKMFLMFKQKYLPKTAFFNKKFPGISEL